MFKSRTRQNEELFTPLLQETQRSDVKNHKFHNNTEEIDMEQMDNELDIDLGDNLPTTSNSTTSKKLANLIDKRNEIRNKRRQNKILELDFEDVAKEPKDCKYYIISIVVPLIVFIFLLVILFAFIVSPVIQGINFMNAANNKMSGNSTSHSGEQDHHHHHDMQNMDHDIPVQTQKMPLNNNNLTSSVKKDGGDKPDDLRNHDHGGEE